MARCCSRKASHRQLERSVSSPTRGVLVGPVTGLLFGLPEGSVLGPSYGLAYAVKFGLTAHAGMVPGARADLGVVAVIPGNSLQQDQDWQWVGRA